MCWWPGRIAARPRPRRRQDRRRRARCCWPMTRRYASTLAEAVAALVVGAGAGYDAIVAPATTTRQELHAARRRHAGRRADLGNRRGRSRRHLRAPDLCRQRDRRPCSRRTPRRSSPCAPPPSRRRRRGRFGAAVETIAAAADPGLSDFVGEELVKSDRPELAAAKIIVSGGRALGSAREFHR